MQGGFRLDAEPSTSDTLTFQGDLYSGNLGIQTGDTARLAGGNLLGRWCRTLPEEGETSLQAYMDRTHIAVPFAATGFAPAGFLKDDLDTYDVELRHTRRWGVRQRFTGGLGYRFTHDAVKQQAPNVAYLPSRLDHRLSNIYAQDEIAIAGSLVATMGAKFEHNAYTGFEFEPTARLRWKPTSEQTWWGAISRAVRMPSRFDRDLYEPAPPNSLIAGGPHFESETVIAYEAGYRAQLNAKVAGSVSIFYNDYDHLRSWGVTPVTVLPVVFENNLDAKTYGAEFNVNVQAADWWRLNAGYNLLREKVRLKPGYFDLQNALDETSDPEHQFSVRSLMALPGKVELESAFRRVTTLHNNDGGVPGTVPAYSELDIRIGWHLNSAIDLALIGRNLLHSHHPEYGPPGPSREEVQRRLFGQVIWRY